MGNCNADHLLESRKLPKQWLQNGPNESGKKESIVAKADRKKNNMSRS